MLATVETFGSFSTNNKTKTIRSVSTNAELYTYPSHAEGHLSHFPSHISAFFYQSASPSITIHQNIPPSPVRSYLTGVRQQKYYCKIFKMPKMADFCRRKCNKLQLSVMVLSDQNILLVKSVVFCFQLDKQRAKMSINS